jgi:AcrR family transcriptional regulator
MNISMTSAEINPIQSHDPDAGLDTTARVILDAALGLFLEFGLRRTTMDDVARKISMTRVTIYRYYADKNALFQAVVLREWMRQVYDIDHFVQQIADPEQRLIESFIQANQRTISHPLIMRLLDSDTEWLLPYLTVKAEAMFKFGVMFLTQSIEKIQSQGSFRHVDAAFVAELMTRVSHSIVLTPTGLANNPAALRDMAERFLLPLLRGKGSA